MLTHNNDRCLDRGNRPLLLPPEKRRIQSSDDNSRHGHYLKQALCERNLTICFRPKRYERRRAAIVVGGWRDKMNVRERQIKTARCRLDKLASHDRLTDRERFRISMPRLNNHAEMDALGVKRRPVFKFLCCDRMKTLACLHRNFKGATKECDARQNNTYYAIRLLQADLEKIAVQCGYRIIRPGNGP